MDLDANHSPTTRELPALLCLSQSFAPDTTPTGIRSSKLLSRLAAEWDVTVLTESAGFEHGEPVATVRIASRRPTRLLTLLRRLRLHKLIDLLVWPDDSIFWVFPAIRAGRRAIEHRRPSAIVVFMMPYSAGLAGIVLSRISRLPLVLNLDDSLTCTDMHPEYPTRLHFHLARMLENLYARSADAIVYVSQRNLNDVAERQPAGTRERFHLVRYGADRAEHEPLPTAAGAEQRFDIAYVGAMSGWWALIDEHEAPGAMRRLYTAWTQAGRYERLSLDHRTSSPAVIGRAILAANAERGERAGRAQLSLHGNPYASDVVERALASAGVAEVVEVHDPVAHDRVAPILAQADLLFLTLPTRNDGSSGGRISAKTYEYLTTDRPILAAVPRGENWDYLEGKPGVWLVEPSDEQRMREIIAELAEAKFAGAPRTFDRSELREELSYDTRAREFATVIRAAISRRTGRTRP